MASATSGGSVGGIASLTHSPAAALETQAGGAGTVEIQNIDMTGLLYIGDTYKLTVGGVTLTSGALSLDTGSNLANNHFFGFPSDVANYAAAGFTLDNSISTIILTWTTPGVHALATLVDTGTHASTTNATHSQTGTAATPEIQTYTPAALITGDTYKLTAGGVTLTTAALAGTATSSITIWPVGEVRRLNLPSMAGVVSPAMPRSRMKP